MGELSKSFDLEVQNAEVQTWISMPFNWPHNCDLVFQRGVPTGDADRYGNPIIEQQPVPVRASVKIDKDRRFRIDPVPGDDVKITFLQGFFLGIKGFPDGVTTNSKGQIRITDLAFQGKNVGEFTVTETIQSRWKQVPKALGTKFAGYMLTGYQTRFVEYGFFNTPATTLNTPSVFPPMALLGGSVALSTPAITPIVSTQFSSPQIQVISPGGVI